LASVAIVRAAADAIVETSIGKLVVDPVFVSKHGHPLLREDAVAELRSTIVPLATVVTPNLPEASGLAGFEVRTRQDMKRAAEAILDLGASSVLVKGGHLDDRGRASDLFFDGDCMEWLEAERIDTPHTHGTGCVLSAAITAHLAKGSDTLEAVS